jgi:hypothetical protein
MLDEELCELHIAPFLCLMQRRRSPHILGGYVGAMLDEVPLDASCSGVDPHMSWAAIFAPCSMKKRAGSICPIWMPHAAV